MENIIIVKTIYSNDNSYQFYHHIPGSSVFTHYYNTLCYSLAEIMEIADREGIDYQGIFNDMCIAF